MIINSSDIWLCNSVEDNRFKYRCLRSDAIIIESQEMFYLLIPYQVYDKELQFGTILDIMGILPKDDAFSYANEKVLSKIGTEVNWINFSNDVIEKVDIASILLWSMDVYEKYNFEKNLDKSCEIFSEFGSLKLVMRR